MQDNLANFDQLAEQFTPMLHSIIRSLHIYQNKEEYFQIGLIELWESSKRFNPEKGNFATFAYRSIQGQMMNELTKTTRRSKRTVYSLPEILFKIADPAAEDYKINELLSAISTGLSPNQKKWLDYTVHYGLNVQEISLLEGVSRSAVKNWRKGARKRINKEELTTR